jgi:hypothetical protein
VFRKGLRKPHPKSLSSNCAAPEQCSERDF